MLGKYLGESYGIQKTLTFSIKTLNKTVNIFQIHKKKKIYIIISKLLVYRPEYQAILV